MRDNPAARRSVAITARLCLAISAALCLLAASPVAAFDAGRFAQRRAVLGVSEAGRYRIEIDPVIYRALAASSSSAASASAGRDLMSQLRLVDAQGEQVPFLVRPVPATSTAVARTATMVDPLSLPSGEARAVFDLGRSGLKHSELTLDIAASETGPGQSGDFLRRVRLERSDDERHFAVLSTGETIFRAQSSRSPAESLRIRYPVSDARYLRVVVLPAADHQRLSVRGATFAFAPAETRLPERMLPASLGDKGQDRASKTSWIVLDLGARGVPLAGVSLTFDNDAFERFVTIDTANDPTLWVPTASAWAIGTPALWASANPASAPVALPVATTRRYLRLTFTDGDDRPLSVRGAQAFYQPEELLFEARAPGEHSLLLDTDEPESPTYDFRSRIARQGDVAWKTGWKPEWKPATFGPIQQVARAPRVTTAPPLPRSERHRAALTVGLIVIVGGLAAWTLRLMRKH